MSNTKETNPKDACGVQKVQFSTVSMSVLTEVAVGMTEGALKYGRHNYRVMGVRGSVYFDATMRHLLAWWEGEDIDPDSGIPHITKAITSLWVLRDAQISEKWTDDRPPKVKMDFIGAGNEKTKKLLDKYKTPIPAYTEV